MRLIPENYNAAFEGAKTVNTAATVVDAKVSDLHLAVSAGKGYIAYTIGDKAMLQVVFTDFGKLCGEPVCIAEKNAKNPISLCLPDGTVRIFLTVDDKPCYVDYPKNYDGEALALCDISVAGIPYDINSAGVQGAFMSVITENGAALGVLDETRTEVKVGSAIKGAKKAAFSEGINGGYMAFCDMGESSALMSSPDGENFTLLCNRNAVKGRPSFAKINRQFYIFEQNGGGSKVSVSLDCRNFETLLEIEENISNISLTEWDSIVFYAAIKGDSIIFGHLR